MKASEVEMRASEVVLTPGQQMLSSGTGAMLVSLFMTPLDVVKIRLQTQDRLFAKKCFLYSNGLGDHLCPRVNGDPPARALHTVQEICDCKWYNRPKYFNGTGDALYKIGKTEGLSSLWSGLSPTLVLAVPTTVIYFTMYEQIKVLLQRTSQAPTLVSLLSGGLARLVSVTLVSPLELVRTKMQSQKMPLSQVKSCLADLVRNHGVLGLWRGYTATLLRDVPFSALYWPLYEQTKAVLGSPARQTSKDYFMVCFASGALAGSVASTVTLPFDVIKTIRQIDIGEKEIMNVRQGQTGTNLLIAKELVREQGVRGLFVGLTPRLLKVAPACAIMISSYEMCKGMFAEQNRLARL